MAETLTVVSAEQFAEFTIRMDQRFDLTHESINHRLEATDKRFDDLHRAVADIRQTLVEMRTESHADMRQLRQWLVGLCVGFVIAIGVALLKGGG